MQAKQYWTSQNRIRQPVKENEMEHALNTIDWFMYYWLAMMTYKIIVGDLYHHVPRLKKPK